MGKQYLLLAIALVFYSCSTNYRIDVKGGYLLLHQNKGQQLGYNPNSGVKIITEKGKAFKDLNKNGKLEPYEDWRLPAEERAKDLASRMSIDQIAGLMLYSGHQSVPVKKPGWIKGTYDGIPYEESRAKPGDLTDQQKKFLLEDNLRHVLVTSVESPAVAAHWNNNAQALVEGIGFGIPVNISSDPRHGSDSYAEYNAGAGGRISMWPGTLGIAATFDPDIMKRFGEVAAQEYRALGITTALSPQIDLATEPRWSRFDGTMGEDPDLAKDMARAYVDGFQTSRGDDVIANGWGYSSVNAMVKHWPGGGPEEGGRDAHFGFGAYAVYPGNNIAGHLKPFTEGAFKLDGATSSASAVMPYYTISYNQDPSGENVGNSFNRFIITDMLRGEYGYEGVICTDWAITKDAPGVEIFSGKCWGVEQLSEAERHYKALEAGVDQFGGNNEMQPVIEAYQIGILEHGEEYMRQRFEASALRLLKNVFRVGLFENPYLDIERTVATVGKPEFMEEGFKAQLKSVIMLKNVNNTLPVEFNRKVYIPKRYTPAGTNWIGMPIPESLDDAFRPEIVSKYFEVVDNPAEADFAIVGIRNPRAGMGYDSNDRKNGGNGYVPVSLQYADYIAVKARDNSIAGGSPFEDFKNRTYKDKKVLTDNITDMNLVLETRGKMGDKPVIVVVKVDRPMVMSEIEPSASAILLHMGVQDQVLMELISGASEPSALLPFQLPAGMATVEEQYEDVPRDMIPYSDSEGNRYDFAFGLNWKGIIEDKRVKEYK
jgi:beta-glucosidase